MLGWFEPIPLFFLLVGIELLMGYRYGWMGSAIAAALGFMIKLTPMLLLPVAVRWLGSRLSWQALRQEWFHRGKSGNLLKPVIYLLLFLSTVVAVGYPIVRANLDLAFSSFIVHSIRPPWQSIWALLDGYYGYGLVALDMRNLVGLETPLWVSSLPWSWLTVGFGLLYLWLYTRPYDWQKPKTLLGFMAISIIWLFLYSKGWSPQFLLWVLAFIVLLLPTLRGVVLAITLSLINFVESYLFLVLLPQERWILWATVITRTVLLLLLAMEFLGQIWPSLIRGRQLQQVSATLTWSVIVISLVGAVWSTPQVAHAYQNRRLADHPCRNTIPFLQAESVWPSQKLLTQQSQVWQFLYPWLRQTYNLHVVDGYSPDDAFVETGLRNLDNLVENEEFWWVSQTDLPFDAKSPGEIESRYFADKRVQLLDLHRFGPCTAQRAVHFTEDMQVGAVDVAGGPILLRATAMNLVNASTEVVADSTHDPVVEKVGVDLHLVLYWQAATEVEESYTVFTQLFDAAGNLVAQQDNLPVQGLAPTNTWQPQRIIRDPYTLSLPVGYVPGRYMLHVGLYNQDGRRPLQFVDGSGGDHLVLSVEIE